MGQVELILGPVVVSVTTNVFLYGICVIQWSAYYSTTFKDRKAIQVLVAWVMLLDTFHTAASVYMLWDYVVTNFNNPAFLSAAPWPFPSTPIVTAFASVPIQIFLAWRIKQFSGSWWLFGMIVTFSFAQGATGCASAIGALLNPNIDAFATLIPIVDSWLSLAVFTDFSITGLLLWYLNKSRTGFRRTDGVISRLIRNAVQTALFASFFCIMDLITFTTLQRTNFHLIFALPMGRIYTNTLMSTLNSRALLRDQLGTAETSFNVTTARFDNRQFNTAPPTQVNVTVGQDIALESYTDTDNSKANSGDTASAYGDPERGEVKHVVL